jgi:hypothetical protein
MSADSAHSNETTVVTVENSTPSESSNTASSVSSSSLSVSSMLDTQSPAVWVYLCIIASNFLSSTLHVTTKYSFNEVPPLVFMFFRTFLAVPGLLLVTFAVDGREQVSIMYTKENNKHFAILGLMVPVGGQLMLSKLLFSLFCFSLSFSPFVRPLIALTDFVFVCVFLFCFLFYSAGLSVFSRLRV